MSDSIDEMIPSDGDGTETPDINDIDIKSMQNFRKIFIKQLLKNGAFPSDPEDRAALLTLMKDTTSTAIASKKLKADEKAVVSQAQIVKNLAEVVRISRSHAAASNRANRQMLIDVPVVEIKTVPGHIDVGCIPISTQSIMNASSLNTDDNS